MSNIERAIIEIVEDTVHDAIRGEIEESTIETSQISDLESEVTRIVEDNFSDYFQEMDPRKFFETCVNVLKSGWDAQAEVRRLKIENKDLVDTLAQSRRTHLELTTKGNVSP